MAFGAMPVRAATTDRRGDTWDHVGDHQAGRAPAPTRRVRSARVAPGVERLWAENSLPRADPTIDAQSPSR